MNPDEPAQGDYGYDLAHEDKGHGDRAHGDRAHEGSGKERVGRHRAPDPDPAHPERTAGAPDPDGDYGYDEAHGY